ncbi:hypothetical protein SOVF_086750, partial [Spinacia oleracea]
MQPHSVSIDEYSA